jgi:hypothetical protein
MMTRISRSAGLAIVVALAVFSSARLHAQTSDDSLGIYAVSVVKTPPFQKQFTGNGIYLGRGMIITAAHVVGHWPFFTHPRVLIAGQDLPAKIVKEGSFEQVDLALLSVEEDRLPFSLRMRRNPLCKDPPKIGSELINVSPGGTSRSQVISPMLIAPELRERFDSLIDTVQGSGSGLFDAGSKCLVGIVSAKVQKYKYQLRNGIWVAYVDGFAGYFVSSAKIVKFLPSDLIL